METFPKKPHYFVITLDRHAGIFIMFSQMCIPPVLPGIAWHVGFAIENWSRQGLGTNKWNDDVLVDGVPICSRGNSPWPVVPHWNLFPYPGIPINPNILIPLLIILSSSKSVLAVGSVVAQKGPIAVMIPGVKVVGVNLACADPIPMPIVNVVLFGQSTVVLGFTLGDLLAALVQWAIDIILAYVMKALGKIAGALGKKLAGRLGNAITGRFTGKLGQRVGNFLQKAGGLGPKGPPGFLKRMHLNALGKANLPKTFHQPKPPGGLFGKLDDAMNQRWLDKALGNKIVKPGQFQSVADTLINAEKKYGTDIAKKLGMQPAKDAIFGAPPQYAPTLSEKLGAMVDGRSEMIDPMLGGP